MSDPKYRGVKPHDRLYVPVFEMLTEKLPPGTWEKGMLDRVEVTRNGGQFDVILPRVPLNLVIR